MELSEAPQTASWRRSAPAPKRMPRRKENEEERAIPLQTPPRRQEKEATPQQMLPQRVQRRVPPQKKEKEEVAPPQQMLPQRVPPRRVPPRRKETEEQPPPAPQEVKDEEDALPLPKRMPQRPFLPPPSPPPQEEEKKKEEDAPLPKRMPQRRLLPPPPALELRAPVVGSKSLAAGVAAGACCSRCPKEQHKARRIRFAPPCQPRCHVRDHHRHLQGGAVLGQGPPHCFKVHRPRPGRLL